MGLRPGDRVAGIDRAAGIGEWDLLGVRDRAGVGAGVMGTGRAMETGLRRCDRDQQCHGDRAGADEGVTGTSGASRSGLGQGKG